MGCKYYTEPFSRIFFSFGYVHYCVGYIGSRKHASVSLARYEGPKKPKRIWNIRGQFEILKIVRFRLVHFINRFNILHVIAVFMLYGRYLEDIVLLYLFNGNSTCNWYRRPVVPDAGVFFLLFSFRDYDLGR